MLVQLFKEVLQVNIIIMSEEKKVKYRYLVAEYYFFVENHEPANNNIGSTMIDTAVNPPILFKKKQSAKKYLKSLIQERYAQIKEKYPEIDELAPMNEDGEEEDESVYYICQNEKCLYKCEINKIIYYVKKVPKFKPLSDMNLEKVGSVYK